MTTASFRAKSRNPIETDRFHHGSFDSAPLRSEITAMTDQELLDSLGTSV